jgi:hypothetical protein
MLNMTVSQGCSLAAKVDMALFSSSLKILFLDYANMRRPIDGRRLLFVSRTYNVITLIDDIHL